MSKFINYKPQIGYSVSTNRNNGSYCNAAEFGVEVKNDKECCCDYEERVGLNYTVQEIIQNLEAEG